MGIDDNQEEGSDAPLELPIDGVLDLHTFRPRDVKEVVLAYLEECQKRDILKIRIIHGKGIGQLRQTVHTLLDRHPQVVSYVLAGEAFGGWGATMVTLRSDRRPEEEESPGNPSQ